uniref:Bm1120 n=1 Tax=Brugia malayi TaxID=6279 RepID=A0A0H5SED7_BRUMA|nr:Bm1120 [Brugia malayi]
MIAYIHINKFVKILCEHLASKVSLLAFQLLFSEQFQQMHPFFLLPNGLIVCCIKLASGMKHIFQKNPMIKFNSNAER